MSDTPTPKPESESGPTAPAAPDDWWTEPTEPASGTPEEAKATPWRTWVAIGVGVFVLGVAAAVGVHALGSKSSPSAAADGAPGANGQGGGFGQGRQPGPRGTITEISGSTLTVKSQDGSSVRVTTSGSTKVTETVEGELGDLAKGDIVMVRSDDTGATVTATAITEVGDDTFGGLPGGQGGSIPNGGTFPGGGQPPDGGTFPGGGQPPDGGTFPGGGQPPDGGTFPGGGQPPDGGTFPGGGQPPDGGSIPNGGFGGTIGTIESVSGSTLTIKTFQGDTVTVKTTGSTTVSVTKDITVAELAKGDTVNVQGATSGSTVAATTIRKGELGGFGGGFPGAGAPPGASGSTPTTTP